MGFSDKLFKKKDSILPCKTTGDCPYEYDKGSDRDVEGMPFLDTDPRSCPEYGHICPKFMEDFGLTVEELNIRATIHCGSLLDYLVETGQVDVNSSEYKALVNRYEELTRKYPRDRYPRYY
jgi:hypothetical protein